MCAVKYMQATASKCARFHAWWTWACGFVICTICAYFPLSRTHTQTEWNALADAHETWAKLYLNSGNDHITSDVGCQVNN